ncbi:hypothetical protein BV898_15432 [Hypsibius exemplaris]|uniref:Uncharacterized protein n=1 Tax=Hypsibius exemplaris TaxID=2072580 RepID=A0A9X6RKQ4_HYPEX|nr:hypothetical protein BV898_15432 [Hypsibius exemplaris]
MAWEDEAIFKRLGRHWRKADLISKVAALNIPHSGVYANSSKGVWFGVLRDWVKDPANTDGAAVEEASAPYYAASSKRVSAAEADISHGTGRFVLKPIARPWQDHLAALFDSGSCLLCKSALTRQVKGCHTEKTQTQHLRDRHPDHAVQKVYELAEVVNQVSAFSTKTAGDLRDLRGQTVEALDAMCQ